MWEKLTKVGGTTSSVMLPKEGMVYVTVPDGTELYAFINGVKAPLNHLHINAGDSLRFELKTTNGIPAVVPITYNGVMYSLEVWPEVELPEGTPIVSVDTTYNEVKQEKIMTPAETINLFSNPNQGNGTGGAMGAGLGAGLLGGVLGGALLGGNGNGLFGGRNGDGAAAASTLVLENAIAANERLTSSRFDAQAQGAILADINSTAAATQLAQQVSAASLGVQFAKGQGETNTQNALNAAALGVQIQKTSGDLATQVALQGSSLGVLVQKSAGDLGTQIERLSDNLNKDILQTKYDLTTQAAANQYATAVAIKADGDMTRAILINQNEVTLNRMLTTAQNEIIELRGDARLESRTRGIEITTTNNINQMQQQQQQQAQFSQLTGYIASLAQSIQATNQAINVGSGTQTANPLNTNTQIR